MALNRSDKSKILRRYFPGMTRNSEMSTEPKNFKGGKRDAQRQARELLAKRDAGILNATNATVGQLLDKYHADVVMTKNKPRTQVQYRRPSTP